MLAAIEATLETAKNDGIKPESVDAVRAMVHQLMRNKGVREYWEASGRNLFAQDFVNEVDIILKDATNERSEEPGTMSLSICHPHIKFDIKMYGITAMHFEPCLFVIVLPPHKRGFEKTSFNYL